MLLLGACALESLLLLLIPEKTLEFPNLVTPLFNIDPAALANLTPAAPAATPAAPAAIICPVEAENPCETPVTLSK